MDDDYNNIPRNPAGFCAFALFCGVVGTVIVFTLPDYSMVSTILGAIGMFIGGFSISLANHCLTGGRPQFMLLAAVGILTSVIAFIFGLRTWLG